MVVDDDAKQTDQEDKANHHHVQKPWNEWSPESYDKKVYTWNLFVQKLYTFFFKEHLYKELVAEKGYKNKEFLRN